MSETNDGLPPGMKIEHNPELGAQLQKFQDDYFWFLKQRELREQYGERAVVLHNRQVIGVGETYREAEEDACRRAAERGEELPAAREMSVFFVPVMVYLDDSWIPPYQDWVSSEPKPPATERID
jgi:hypothetical protein